MKIFDVACPSCGAQAGVSCENIVKFRNRETGEMKMEWRQTDPHKQRKRALAMEILKSNALLTQKA